MGNPSISSSFGFGFGARYMMDQEMKFKGEGLTPIYLRMQIADVSQDDFADIGITPLSVSGALNVSGGYVDYLINPQPLVDETPSRRGSGAKEVQLQVGMTRFTVSQTWALGMQQQFGYKNIMSVWRDPRVIGLIYFGEVMTIESIYSRSAGGQVVYWEIEAKNAEVNVTG